MRKNDGLLTKTVVFYATSGDTELFEKRSKSALLCCQTFFNCGISELKSAVISVPKETMLYIAHNLFTIYYFTD